MKDMGVERKNQMYPTMAAEQKVIDYPSLRLPCEFFSKDPELGDIIDLNIKIKVTSVIKDKYCNEVGSDVIQGEIKEEPKGK